MLYEGMRNILVGPIPKIEIPEGRNFGTSMSHQPMMTTPSKFQRVKETKKKLLNFQNRMNSIEENQGFEPFTPYSA